MTKIEVNPTAGGEQLPRPRISVMTKIEVNPTYDTEDYSAIEMSVMAEIEVNPTLRADKEICREDVSDGKN